MNLLWQSMKSAHTEGHAWSTLSQAPIWILGLTLMKYQESGGWPSNETNMVKEMVSLSHAPTHQWPPSRPFRPKVCQKAGFETVRMASDSQETVQSLSRNSTKRKTSPGHLFSRVGFEPNPGRIWVKISHRSMMMQDLTVLWLIEDKNTSRGVVTSGENLVKWHHDQHISGTWLGCGHRRISELIAVVLGHHISSDHAAARNPNFGTTSRVVSNARVRGIPGWWIRVKCNPKDQFLAFNDPEDKYLGLQWPRTRHSRSLWILECKTISWQCGELPYKLVRATIWSG